MTMSAQPDIMAGLLAEVRACQLCTDLPLGPRPLLQMGQGARILVVGQAPGRITHHKGIPFDDPSGNRLRAWMGVDRATFYDPGKVAIMAMSFCYPGTGKGGDLPPRPECAAHWRARLLQHLPDIALTLVIGRYAMDWHLPRKTARLADMVRDWRERWPALLPLPHPSPRNNRWLANHPWFEGEVVPVLQDRVAELLTA